jgi:hypothetical protein
VGDAAASREPTINPYATPRSLQAEQTQFALSSLFLIVTLVCICLGLWSLAPGLIIPLLVIVVPAFIRTLASTSQATRGSNRLSAAEKTSAFFTSLGIVILIFIAGGIAFGTACAMVIGVVESTNFGNSGTEIGWLVLLAIVGLIATLAFMVWLLVKTWPKRK